MKKVLLAGATGHFGRHLLLELKQQGFYVKVLVRSARRARDLMPEPDEILRADATKPETLKGCCEGIDVVISALGKSISLKNREKASFHDINWGANYNLLQEAMAAGVPQFIYTSAFKAEQYPKLAFFKAHADFSDTLRSSGISYTILQPTALFSVFEEVVAMARKRQIGIMGSGSPLTNPIYEGDLAKVAVEQIGAPSREIPLGGQTTYSRHDLVRIACQVAKHKGKVLSVPFAVVDTILPLVKLLNRNLFDKLAFLIAVSKVDCVAPQVGNLTLEEYFEISPLETTSA
ncbi:SDR family oxidoreductase [Pontibacter locisalis]|uniref:SDR family oxidoreductase n=1 Tax=Pontibacter locisalis TaxID=1719035 RepID=A0ABW5ITU8_9BACT